MQITLLVATGTFQLIAAVLGAYMSGRRHPAWFAVFIVLGLSGVGATTWQGVLNIRSANESKVLLRKISDDVASFTGHPIDSASLENIQRGISELKASRRASETAPLVTNPDHPQRAAKRRIIDLSKRMEAPQADLNPTEPQRIGYHPWWLTQEQISQLANEMRPFADGTNRLGLVNVMYWDSASERLAEDFVSAFRAAGWNLPGRGVTGLGPSNKRHYHEGIQLMVHSEDQAPKGLAEFKRTLQKFGMESAPSIDETVPEDRFRILIGVRPKD